MKLRRTAYHEAAHPIVAARPARGRPGLRPDAGLHPAGRCPI